jgi:C_GCAxxG_C_C family probable redox protein
MEFERTKEELGRQLDQKAAEKLAVSGHCAQTSFAVLTEHFQLDGGQILKALTPMPGIALRGETCGAVVGSLMALGLVYGREELDDQQGFVAAIPPAREFCRRFEEQVGGTRCDDILTSGLGKPMDLSKRAGFEEYLSCGGTEVCLGVIQTGIRIAADIISPAEDESTDPGVMLTA